VLDVEYQAASPDEKALAIAAKNLQYFFYVRYELCLFRGFSLRLVCLKVVYPGKYVYDAIFSRQNFFQVFFGAFVVSSV